MKNISSTKLYILGLFLSISVINTFAQDNFYTTLKPRFLQYCENGLIDSKKHSISFSITSNFFTVKYFPTSVIQEGYEVPLRIRLIQNKKDFSVQYQFSLKNNFKLESTARLVSNFSNTPYNINSFTGRYQTLYMQTSIFKSLSLDLGLRYDIIINNSIRLFNINFGGYLTNNLSYSSSKTSNVINVHQSKRQFLSNNGDLYTLNLSESYTLVKRSVLGVYIGVSKDISLTKNLFITLQFNNYFGTKNVLTRHTINYDIPEINLKNSTIGSIDGGGQTYSLGLRWVLD